MRLFAVELVAHLLQLLLQISIHLVVLDHRTQFPLVGVEDAIIDHHLISRWKNFVDGWLDLSRLCLDYMSLDGLCPFLLEVDLGVFFVGGVIAVVTRALIES